MVRLVFRPYTHVRRTICTSVSLRASIRISPDFTLHKHSSPSFGSQLISSCSTFHKRSDAAGDAPVKGLSSRFLCTPWFSTIKFAHKLDSLVRVSRRVGTLHKAWSWRCTAQSHPTTCQSQHRMIQAKTNSMITKGRIHLVASLPSTASPAAFTEHKSKASLLLGFLRHQKATRLD